LLQNAQKRKTNTSKQNQQQQQQNSGECMSLPPFVFNGGAHLKAKKKSKSRTHRA
jgi:hypothetical protein